MAESRTSAAAAAAKRAREASIDVPYAAPAPRQGKPDGARADEVVLWVGSIDHR